MSIIRTISWKLLAKRLVVSGHLPLAGECIKIINKSKNTGFI
jgi:hypothetical protein